MVATGIYLQNGIHYTYNIFAVAGKQKLIVTIVLYTIHNYLSIHLSI